MSRFCSPIQAKKAFTLVELLVTVVLISMLLAMLAPVFVSVREKSRQSLCLSNLRQIGQAIAMYADDYDSRYPYGIDPVDKYTYLWNDSTITDLPLLPSLLAPYVKHQKVWCCPSDTGFDFVEFLLDEKGNSLKLDARPSLFASFGTSYLYRTELALHQVLFPATGKDKEGNSHGAAEINILQDGYGSWHGVTHFDLHYNVLFADGHVRFCNWLTKERAWDLKLEK